MTVKKRFHYKWQVIVPSYVILLVLAVLGLWAPFPTTFLVFLKEAPGIFLIYACVVVAAFALVVRLPTFVRALLRIPAVEFDGEIILVRGWTDMSFSVRSPDHTVFQINSDQSVITVSAGDKLARISLRQLEGPRTLVQFLASVLPKA